MIINDNNERPEKQRKNTQDYLITTWYDNGAKEI